MKERERERAKVLEDLWTSLIVKRNETNQTNSSLERFFLFDYGFELSTPLLQRWMWISGSKIKKNPKILERRKNDEWRGIQMERRENGEHKRIVFIH